jgi:hypothetical protein
MMTCTWLREAKWRPRLSGRWGYGYYPNVSAASGAKKRFCSGISSLASQTDIAGAWFIPRPASFSILFDRSSLGGFVTCDSSSSRASGSHLRESTKSRRSFIRLRRGGDVASL